MHFIPSRWNFWKDDLKGVLHPWPILWLLMHFSQLLKHIGDKYDMFLIGDIPKIQLLL